MADQANIQDIVNELSDKFDIVQKEMVDAILKLVKNKSKAEAINIINELNFNNIGSLKTSTIRFAYTSSAIQILRQKKMFADISEETLQALLTQSQQYLSGEIAGMSNAIQQEVVSGIINNKVTDDIVEAIGKKGYGAGVGMKRIVGDGLNNYSRAVGRMMMDEAPENTKYVYIGPADEKTRGFCLTLIQAGARTKKEIE